MDENTIPPTAWVEYPSEKRPYFYNRETMKTTWTIPGDYFAWKEGVLKAYLKTTNWKKAFDKERAYYYDKITKKTQWDVPTDVANYEANLLEFNAKRYELKKRKLEEVSSVVPQKALPVVPLFDKVSSPVSPENEVVDKFQEICRHTGPTISTTEYKSTVVISSIKHENGRKTNVLDVGVKGMHINRDNSNSDSDEEEDYLAADDYVIQATPLYTLDKKVFNQDNINDLYENVEDDNVNESGFNENSINSDDNVTNHDFENGNETMNEDTQIIDFNNDIDPYTQETDRDRDPSQSQSQSQFTQETEENIAREDQSEHEAEERSSLNMENGNRNEDYDLYGQDQYTQDQDWARDQEREKEMQLKRDTNRLNNNQERTPDLGYVKGQERTPDLGYEIDQERTPDLGYEKDQERTPDLGYENYDEQDHIPNGSEENFDNYGGGRVVVSQTDAEGEIMSFLRI